MVSIESARSILQSHGYDLFQHELVTHITVLKYARWTVIDEHGVATLSDEPHKLAVSFHVAQLGIEEAINQALSAVKEYKAHASTSLIQMLVQTAVCQGNTIVESSIREYDVTPA